MDFSGITHNERDGLARLNEADGRAMACLRELKARDYNTDKLHDAIKHMGEAREDNNAAGMELLLGDLARELEAMDASPTNEAREKLAAWTQAMDDVNRLADMDLGRVCIGAAIGIQDRAREDYLNCLEETND